MTLVGISSYAEPARWGPWHAPAALLPLSYAEQVAAAGGYGAQPHPRTSRVQPGRDRAELDLLAAALAAGLPVLAICRGLQILNVLRGGSLRQHLPEAGGHRAGPGTFGTHQVRVAPGSRLGRLLGPPDAGGELWLDVPTAHHQAIGRLGAGLVATAWAADGTIEAVETAPDDRGRFLIAVQWHPEAGADPRLFRALTRFARERVTGKPAPAEPLDSPA